MAWLRVDDGMADHPKILTAGPLALTLQIRAMCYTSRHETDGFLPDSVIASLTAGLEAPAQAPAWPDAMVNTGLWERRDGGFFVHDFLDYNPSKVERQRIRRIKQRAGKLGGKAKSQHSASTMVARCQPSAAISPSPSPSPSPKDRYEKQQQGKKQLPSPGAQKPAPGAPAETTWNGYRTAYAERYRTDPVRNSKVNGMLATFLKRIPRDEAPEIAAFYVRHQAGFYVRAGHPVELLLRDAEKLRTEWATDRMVTETEAHEADRRQGVGDRYRRIIRQAEADEARGGTP